MKYLVEIYWNQDEEGGEGEVRYLSFHLPQPLLTRLTEWNIFPLRETEREKIVTFCHLVLSPLIKGRLKHKTKIFSPRNVDINNGKSCQ